MTQSILGSSLKAKRLFQKMAAFRIKESDLKEEFVASPGPGGQNVNKVATCVVLTHIPSGRMVKCHKYRTQAANRVYARELLADMFEGIAHRNRQDRQALKAKERARHRKRSVRGKEKMLEQKKKRSELKQLRKRVV